MTAEAPTVAQVIEAYIKIRDKKDAIEREAKDKVRVLKAQMEKIEGYLKIQIDKSGANSIACDSGTAFTQSKDYANVADWDATLEFIKSHNAYYMLTKGVSKLEVRNYIEEHKAPPPGVTYGSSIEVKVRRPNE